MKKRLKTGTIILIVCCVIGLCALLYPSVSNYWNENFAAKAVTQYEQHLVNLTEDDYQKMWEAAIRFNNASRASSTQLPADASDMEEYNSCLNVAGTGMMGYIEIPSINVNLPIFHGTSQDVLETSVGHLEWSSLPTGGLGTHCLLSGHRGLPSAKLFTDLDKLREGDTFTLSILDQDLTYEVDQIRTVLPTDLSDLMQQPTQDLCTLITCTPYGINTHRLLVRGHRIQTDSGLVRVISEAVQIDEVMVAIVLSIPVLFLLVMAVMLKKPKKVKKIEVLLRELQTMESEKDEGNGKNASQN